MLSFVATPKLALAIIFAAILIFKATNNDKNSAGLSEEDIVEQFKIINRTIYFILSNMMSGVRDAANFSKLASMYNTLEEKKDNIRARPPLYLNLFL